MRGKGYTCCLITLFYSLNQRLSDVIVHFGMMNDGTSHSFALQGDTAPSMTRSTYALI